MSRRAGALRLVGVLGLALAACIPDTDSPLCLGGASQCGDRCVSLSLDPAHCGACDAACGPGEVCHDGRCGVPCGAGEVFCDGECVTLAWHPHHCGACGVGCTIDEVCVDGVCGAECLGGSVQCGDRCVDTSSDAAHCGGCDRPCPTGGGCVAGECLLDCGSALLCGGQCVDQQTDSTNCGECGAVCLSGRTCVEASCLPWCGDAVCDPCHAWWALQAGPVSVSTTAATPGAKAIATGADGRTFVAFDFAGAATLGSVTYTSAGGYDILVAELDPTGGVKWVKQLGDTSTDRGYALAVLDSDSIVLTGHVGGTVSFGNDVVTATGLDGFVAALSSADGEPLWVAQLASAAADHIDAVAVANGSVFVGGYYSAQATLVPPAGASVMMPPPAGLEDAFVARLDGATGEVSWATGFGDTQSDQITDVVAAGGAAHFAGWISRDHLLMPPAPLTIPIGAVNATLSARKGALVATFSEGGVAQWARVVSFDPDKVTNGQAESSAIALAPDGHLWMLGRFASSVTIADDTLLGYGGFDAMLVRMDLAGSLVGGWAFGGTGTEVPAALAIDDDGKMVVAGASNGSMTSLYLGGAKLDLPTAGDNDVFVISLDPPVDLDSPPAVRCARSFGDALAQAATSLAVRQGVAFIGGGFRGSIAFDATTLTSAMGSDAFVAALGYR